LAFSWDDPLGNRDNFASLSDVILEQIATIFARLDTDNDGKVYPRDIRNWRKMVYFGSPEDKLIWDLIPIPDDADLDDENAMESYFVTYKGFYSTLLKHYILYTELWLQCLFLDVVYSTYCEKVLKIDNKPSRKTVLEILQMEEGEIDLNDADLKREIKEYELSDSTINGDYMSFNCVVKLRLLRTEMVLRSLENKTQLIRPASTNSSSNFATSMRGTSRGPASFKEQPSLKPQGSLRGSGGRGGGKGGGGLQSSNSASFGLQSSNNASFGPQALGSRGASARISLEDSLADAGFDAKRYDADGKERSAVDIVSDHKAEEANDDEEKEELLDLERQYSQAEAELFDTDTFFGFLDENMCEIYVYVYIFVI
jgi:hypothetical protein